MRTVMTNMLKRATRALSFKNKPLLGARSGAQHGRGAYPGIATTGLGGFTPPASGSYETYRRMDAHPTIALARSIVLSPVYRNGWGWKLRHGPKEWKEFAQRIIEPLRPRLIRDGLRGLDYGWFGGEIVWEERQGRLCISRVKPLLPDITTILADDGGEFAGLENRPSGGEQAILRADEGKAFLYTYDGEADNLYGRSRHENVRHQAWGPSLQVAEKLAQYLNKVAGLVIQLHYPEAAVLKFKTKALQMKDCKERLF
jgi:hypothetical protein